MNENNNYKPEQPNEKVEEPKVEMTEEEKVAKREESKKAVLEAIKQKAIKDSGMSEEDAKAALEMLNEANMPVIMKNEDFKLGPQELDIRGLSEENYKQMMFRVTLLNGVYLRNLVKIGQDIINLLFVELDTMGVENLLKSSDKVLERLQKEQNEMVAKQILDQQKKRN